MKNVIVMLEYCSEGANKEHHHLLQEENMHLLIECEDHLDLPYVSKDFAFKCLGN